jgi:hypothetical protein
MSLAMLVVDHLNECFHECGVVGRIVMAASRCTEITMRSDTWSDSTARVTNRDLQVLAEIGKDARRSREQRRAKATTCKSAHLDPDGAPVESASVPGIVREFDHLRRLVPVLTNDEMRGDT